MFGFFKKKETSPMPERRGKRDEIVSFHYPLYVRYANGALQQAKQTLYIPKPDEWVWFERREEKHLGIGMYETVPVARFRACLTSIDNSDKDGKFETWKSELKGKVPIGHYDNSLLGNWYITGPVARFDKLDRYDKE